MKTRITLIVIFVNTLFIYLASAQLSLDTYSANLGMIRTTYSSYPKYVFYPELQLGGNLFTSSFRWSGYWGYWTDGIDQPFSAPDMVTYSRQIHILGIRVAFFPARGIIGIFGGVARHLTSVHYVGGFGFDGRPGHDFDESVSTIEIGINADLPLFGPFNIRGEIHQFFPVGERSNDREQQGRIAYTIGLEYKL
jgi:hypothetical protein